MVEKGFEVGRAKSFCSLLGVSNKFSQDSKNFVRGYGTDFSFTEFDLKIAKDVAVIAKCIFLEFVL